MSWALVFSGQGTLHSQMLPWLARDQTMQHLEAEFGSDWRAGLDAPGAVANNRRAQGLLTGTGCAAWQQLQALVDPPAIVAGYSVGELPAFTAAGVFDAATACALADARATCMDAAAADTDTGLLAVSGATPDGLAALRTRHGLEVAIRIDAGSVVLGGPRAALHVAATEAESQGWRPTLLNVALASHTRWMAGAPEAFARVLDTVHLHAPACALISNALGRVRDADSARRALSQQIAQTVRWDDCMDAVAAQGVSAVLEIGPGQALARMWNERYPGVPARSADEFRSARAVAQWLTRTQAR